MIIQKINLTKFKESKLPLLEQFILLQAVYEENHDLINYMFQELGYSMDDFKSIQSEFPTYLKVQGESPEDVFIRQEAYEFFNSKQLDIAKLAIKLSEIFPAGVKTGGYSVKSHPRVIESKLKKFVKEFPEFSEVQILEAATKYVAERKRNNWAYMKTLQYYIYKDNISTLATDCLTLKDELDETNEFETSV